MREAGLEYNPPRTYAKVDKDRAVRVAAEFEAMEHAPQNVAVKASYDAMIKETLAQWEAIKKTGLKVEPVPAGAPDPYEASPRLAQIDAQENNHLWFFPTDNGFGNNVTGFDPKDNPLFEFTGEEINGHKMRANDVFRIVHDYFGHFKEGVGFRADGEENAWRQHSAMYSPLARGAMTTETRGQNSWLNFGPYGEKNRTAKTGDTVFADQKIGLLPKWTWYEGASDQSVQAANAPELNLGRKGDPAILRQKNVKRLIEKQAAAHPEALPVEYIKDGKLFRLDEKGLPVAQPQEYDLLASSLFKDAAKGIRGEQRRSAYVMALASKLEGFFNQIKDQPEVMAGKEWYRVAREKLTKVFGQDTMIFAQFLAATSARTPVKQNFEQALDAYNQMRQGAFNGVAERYLSALKPMEAGELTFRKSIGSNKMGDTVTPKTMREWLDVEEILPRRTNGKKYNANSMQVLNVIAGVWREKLGGPKTAQFSDNLSGASNEATIDVWAARTLHRMSNEGYMDKWRILPEAETGVGQEDFDVGQDAFRVAALRLGMKPDDLQGVLWFAEKRHWAEKGWTRAAGAELSDFSSLLDFVTNENGKLVLRIDDGQSMMSFDEPYPTTNQSGDNRLSSSSARRPGSDRGRGADAGAERAASPRIAGRVRAGRGPERVAADQEQALFANAPSTPDSLTSGEIAEINGLTMGQYRNLSPDERMAAKKKAYNSLTNKDGERLAPNGRPSNLNERQWRVVRTQAFKKWFGDWEKFHNGKDGNGVWSDASGEVSKVVDENGEPMVMYHGSREAGYESFDMTKAPGNRPNSAFFSNNRRVARTYSGSGNDAKIDEDNGRYYNKGRGIYTVFLNIREPLEADFEGANWDGSREGQFSVYDGDLEDIVFDENGKGHFDYERDAKELADKHPGAIVRRSDDHYQSTNGVAFEAAKGRNDGAIVRSVRDDGGEFDTFEPSDVAIVFDPENIKDANNNNGEFSASDVRILFSNTPKFYSRLAKVIEDKMPNRASKATVTGIISNPQNSIKAEEVKWSGIMPWIDSQAEPITKSDVIDYLAADGSVVLNEVVMKDAVGSSPEARYKAMMDAVNDWTYDEDGDMRDYVLTDGDRKAIKEWSERTISDNDLIKRLDLRGLDDFETLAAYMQPRNGGVQYNQYQLPGGENYREVVLSMPPANDYISPEHAIKQSERLLVEAKERHGDEWPNVNPLYDMRWWQDNHPEEAAEFYRVRDFANKRIAGTGDYKSSHFPDIPNYVAHARMNDRVDSNGKPGTLIEEIQSDRHQAGREKGYRGDLTTGESKKYLDSLPASLRPDAEHLLRAETAAGDASTPYWNRLNAGAPDIDHNAIHDIRSEREDDQIPDAPFRSTWPLQMFKRALADAVASGKSWIGWTTGETQNTRYPDKSRDDKGMKGFYDTILPKEIGKYVKQWGAGVVKGSITNVVKGKPPESMDALLDELDDQGGFLPESFPPLNITPIWRVDITPQMAASVESGQALFANAPRLMGVDLERKSRLEVKRDAGTITAEEALELRDIMNQEGSELSPDSIINAKRVPYRGVKEGHILRPYLDNMNYRAKAGAILRSFKKDWAPFFTYVDELAPVEKRKDALHKIVDKFAMSDSPESKGLWDAYAALDPDQLVPEDSEMVKEARELLPHIEQLSVMAMAAPDFPNKLLKRLADKLPSEQELSDLSSNLLEKNPNASDTDREMAVAEAVRNKDKKPQTTKQWEDKARQMIAENREGIIDQVLSGFFDGAGIDNPELMVAARLLKPILMEEAVASGNPEMVRRAQAFVYAAGAGLSETARALRAARDPLNDHRSNVLDILTNLTTAVPSSLRHRILIAPTPGAKRAKINELQKRIKRLESRLRDKPDRETAGQRTQAKKDLELARGDQDRQQLTEAYVTARRTKVLETLKAEGLSEDDIFITPDSRISAHESDVVREAMAKHPESQHEAIRYLMRGYSHKQVSSMTGLPLSGVAALHERYRSQSLKQSVAKWAGKGRSLMDIIRSGIRNVFGGGEQQAKAPMPWSQAKSAIDPNLSAEIERQLAVLMPTATQVNNGSLKATVVKVRRPKGSTGPQEYRVTIHTKFSVDDFKSIYALARSISISEATTFDKLYEYWINNLLSGPTTNFVNVVGNSLTSAIHFLPQRFFESTWNLLGIGGENSATFGEFGEIAKGLLPGLQKAWANAILAFSSEADPTGHQFLNEPMRLEFDTSGDIAKIGGYRGPSISGTKGRIARLSGRMLKAMDAAFKTFIMHAEVGAQAYRLGKIAQKHGAIATGSAALEQFITSEINIPGSMSWNASMRVALELTFQDSNWLTDLGKQLTQIPQHRIDARKKKSAELEAAGDFDGAAKMAVASNALIIASKLMSIVFPFVKTPANIIRMGLRKSPLGSINIAAHLLWMIGNGAYRFSNGKPYFNSAGRAQLVKLLAEQTQAFIVLGFIMSAAEGDDDDDDKKVLLVGGRSWKLKGESDEVNRKYGGQYMLVVRDANGNQFRQPFGKFEPVATILGTTVDTTRRLKLMFKARKLGEAGGNYQDAFNAILGDLANQAEDKSFLQGFSSMMQEYESIKSSGGIQAGIGESVAKSLLTAIIPNIIRQPWRNLDDTLRDSKKKSVWHDAFPSGDFAEPIIDIYGQDVKKDELFPGSRILIPAATAQTKLHPIEEHITAWNNANMNDKIQPTNLGRRDYYVTGPNKAKVPLITPKERTEFERRVAREFVKSLDIIAANVKPTELPEKFDDIIRNARADAKRKVRGEFIASPFNAARELQQGNAK
jgi:hypothetical protein